MFFVVIGEDYVVDFSFYLFVAEETFDDGSFLVLAELFSSKLWDFLFLFSSVFDQLYTVFKKFLEKALLQASYIYFWHRFGGILVLFYAFDCSRAP